MKTLDEVVWGCSLQDLSGAWLRSRIKIGRFVVREDRMWTSAKGELTGTESLESLLHDTAHASFLIILMVLDFSRMFLRHILITSTRDSTLHHTFILQITSIK